MTTMLLQIQQPEVLVGIIGAIGAVLAASIPYYLTKRNEITMNIQKTKLERYDDLLQKFVLWLQAITTYQAGTTPKEKSALAEQRKKASIEFIMAYQRASSYASPKVLSAIRESIDFHTRYLFRDVHTADEFTKIIVDSSRINNNVFIAIREDIIPKEKHFSFNSIIYPSTLETGPW